MRDAKARFVVLSLLLSCSPRVAAAAAVVDTTGITACAISGWSDDDDPAGLNVRAAPRADAAVLSRIPPPQSQGGDSYAAEFKIIGSRNGWLLISGVKFADYGNGKGDHVLFAGPGWVFADKVRFLVNRPEVRSAPTATAKVVTRLQTDDHASGPDSAAVDHVYGCSGEFADAGVHMPDQHSTRGWVTGICSNQVTTCP